MASSRNVNKTGEWKTWEQLIPELDSGDLVEIQRGPIQHWAVYVETVEGKGIIVHVNGDVLTGLGKVAQQRELADIRVEDLGAIVGGCEVRVNNASDAKYAPFATGEEVVKRGLSKLGQHAYDPFNFNCEHWANWCRNGNRISLQADEIVAKREQALSAPKAAFSDFKKKMEDLKKNGPPPLQPPPKVELPAEALERLPFLQKFNKAQIASS